jgi:hypothetical protein
MRGEERGAGAGRGRLALIHSHVGPPRSPVGEPGRQRASEERAGGAGRGLSRHFIDARRADCSTVDVERSVACHTRRCGCQCLPETNQGQALKLSASRHARNNARPRKPLFRSKIPSDVLAASRPPESTRCRSQAAKTQPTPGQSGDVAVVRVLWNRRRDTSLNSLATALAGGHRRTASEGGT